ncbi:MAG TPA: cytochrome c [Candidatus Acidoferrales bacterium]|nr:cytochrome c [Candidatus Acidoferrales bacterium]
MICRTRALTAAAAGALLLGSWGCAPGEENSQAAPAAEQGKVLYDMHCAACHEDTKLDLAKKPPKLDGIFERRSLPSGAPATEEQVRKTILEGRGIMPPFGQSLSKEDVDDLVAYLRAKGKREK